MMKRKIFKFVLVFQIIAISACNAISSQSPNKLGISPSSAVPSSDSVTTISQIQGAQHRSPLEGQTVSRTSGIVTAITGSGFYLQDPAPDFDEHTSDGIFVETTQMLKVKVGDEVVIFNGIVKEFNPAGVGENSLTITEIQTSNFEVISHGNLLPEPIILGEGGRQIPNQIIENDGNGYVGRDGIFDPEEDGLDFYESLEGMRVQVNDALAVSPISQYREVVVVADNGKAATLLSTSGALVIRKEDFNPERIMLDDTFINLPDIRVGAHFTQPIVGIISYDFGNYRLEPTEKLEFTQGTNQAEAAVFSIEDGQVAVATYNVENLDAYAYPQRLEQLAQQIVNNLGSPDIVALQEIQDDDGVIESKIISADKTLLAITQAIQQLGGPEYRWLSIDPQNNADGGVNGGNIRQVLLYRQDRGLTTLAAPKGDAETEVTVNLVEGQPQLSLNPGRIGPHRFAFSNSRKPLVAQFSFNGKQIFVINNHLNSKGEDGALYGEIQPPPLYSETQRMQQAQIIHDFVTQIFALDKHSYVIVLGDLNDFNWSAPLQALAGNELVNLIERLPENERYTYIYEGNAQALDHILVSSALAERLIDFDIVHLNSEMLVNERLSDHDAVFAVFDLN